MIASHWPGWSWIVFSSHLSLFCWDYYSMIDVLSPVVCSAGQIPPSWIIFTISPSHHATSALCFVFDNLLKMSPSSQFLRFFSIILFINTIHCVYQKNFTLKGFWENSQCLISSNNGTHSINLLFFSPKFLSCFVSSVLTFTLRICSKDKLWSSGPQNLLTKQTTTNQEKDEAFYPINCCNKIYETKYKPIRKTIRALVFIFSCK